MESESEYAFMPIENYHELDPEKANLYYSISYIHFPSLLHLFTNVSEILLEYYLSYKYIRYSGLHMCLY